MVLKAGDVLATRDDGAALLYDSDDEYGRPLGRIRQGQKTYDVHPVMALLARGGWDETKKPVTAAGDSWRWQLRDGEGRWIEMGSEVRWLSQGRWLNGKVVGSPSPGVATIEESGTKNLRDLPAARLEVLESQPSDAAPDSIDLSGRYTRVTYRPTEGRARSVYLRNATRVPIPGGEAVSGTEVDREGSIVDRIHLIDTATIDRAVPVEISLKYGTLKDVVPTAEAPVPEAPRQQKATIRATHITSPENAARLRESGFTRGTKGLGSDWGTGIYLGTDPGSAEHYQRFIPGGEAVDVEVDLKNPARVTITYDPKNNDGGLGPLTRQIPGLREELLKRNGIANIGMTSYDMQGIGTPVPEVLNSEALTPSLQALGYDGLVLNEVDAAGMPTITDFVGGSQIVAFDPSTVRVAGKAEVPSAEFWDTVLDEPPEIPERVRARELKPGDVYVDARDGRSVRVISTTSEHEDYVSIHGVVIDGKNAGSAVMTDFAKYLYVPYKGNLGDEPQDFDRDVIEPVKARVAALREKYPDGLARAIDAALAPPEAGPAPEMSDRLKELGRDPEVVRWMYQEGEVHARLNAARDADPYSPETTDLEKEMRSLAPHYLGGKILEYDNLLFEHRREYRDWMDSKPSPDLIAPHTDKAKEILAEVEEIGKMVRIGIVVDNAQRRPEFVAAQPEQPVGTKSADIFRALEEMKATAPDPLTYTPERTPEYLARENRQRLAAHVVAEVAGAAHRTDQTWDFRMPEGVAVAKHLRELRPQEQEAMTGALLRYPASWVANFDRVTWTTSFATRAYNHSSSGRHHIAVSDFTDQGLAGGISDEWSAMVHEQGHGMEQLVPGLAGLEAIFWHNRLGEASEKKFILDDDAMFPTPDPPGPSLGVPNIARPTAQRYTLKFYGNLYSKRNKSWEVFTTGVQEVLGDGNTGYTVKWGPEGMDAELWDFTMGALLGLDGRGTELM